MSSDSAHLRNCNADAASIDVCKPNDAEISKKSIFQSPKTVQGKLLCYSACFLFIAMMVFLSALCIITQRWKASLFKLTFFNLNEDMVCETEPCKETAEKLLSSLDPTTDPCVDFYQYACGGWMDNNPIPNGKNAVRTYDIRKKEVSDMVLELLGNLTLEVEEKPTAMSALGRLYRGCIDKETRGKRSTEPLLKLVKDMGGWPMLEGPNWNSKKYFWYKHTAECNRKLSLDIIAKVSLIQNLDTNNIYSPAMEKGEYIFEKYYNEIIQNQSSVVNQDLIESIAKTATRLGSRMETKELREEARKLVIFEYGLSITGSDSDKKLYKGLLQRLDEIATLNLLKRSNFTYKEFLNLHLQSDIVITDETFIYAYPLRHFVEIPSYIDEVDPRIVANYIGYRVVYTFSRYASEDIWNLRFGDIVLWDGRMTCTSLTELFMEYALDRLYIDKCFSSLTRYHVKKMVEMIRLAYSSTFDQNLWMDKKTTLNAIIKLRNMESTVGHPEWIADDHLLNEYYEKALDMNETEYFESVLQLSLILGDARFSNWNKTVNRVNGLKTSAATVNAYYKHIVNAMIIPAGILGFPFYKFGRIDSINYGALGSLIGHEISHGFDATGREFDHEGNLRNWWTSDTYKKFVSKTRCFIKQYESYKLDPEIKVNGDSTLSENIADNGAVRNAFKAFRLHLALSDEDMTHRKTLPGLPATPEQLFFLGYASIWCTNWTRHHLKYMAENSEHSPNKMRVNVPLSNFKEFARAFKCDPGTPMNPGHKCVLW